ncbi:major facilitator superfamily domain-containing protein [Aspergillus pseudonomiae]|uniref:Major facilitator superfamily domain-containing protein n=1 Tax=Aspergillus pseudonomiae TaxID=1506151 RepID=A0A5N7D9R2_9EURO|nr:major facilitator superfamily domain-containing protein [Aspergillus pseudonomiae]KAE8403212.1 major facilitator superfamily domain-containing protein [Aspergillus pseudonomiae]
MEKTGPAEASECDGKMDDKVASTTVPAPRNNEARPAAFSSTIQEILFVAVATMAIAMSSLLTGTITVLTSQVQRDLNMTTAELTWLTSASSLASGSFLLFFGRLADLFGRKALFIGGMAFFAVFALAAGFSKTPMQVDILNGVMGLMSAASVPPAQGMLANIYEKPSKRKNRVFACFSAGNPLGFVFGSIFSGIATQLFNWRASFFLLAIIYVVIVAIALVTVPADNTPTEKLSVEAVKRFDVVGTILTVAGIGLFSAALSLGSDAPQGWKTPYVLVCLILGVLLIVAFVFWECWFSYPLIPMSIWRDRDFSLVIAVLLLGFLAFPIMTFWISLFMQEVKQYSALPVAVHMLPMAIMGIIVNIVAGLIMHRVSNALLMLLGATSYVGSFLLMGLQHSDSSYWAFIFPGLLLAVIGADFEFCVANMYVMSSLPPEQQSIAGGIFQTVTKLCVAIGMGISTAIFDAVQARGTTTTGYFKNDPIEPYSATFLYCAGIASLGIPLCAFLKIGRQGHGGDGKKGTDDEKV